MTEYRPGHVKQRIETLEIAIRTAFPEDDERLAQMAWLVAGPRFGAKHASTDQVADWTDLFTPPEQPA